MEMEPIKQTFPFKLYQTIEWASDSEFSSALSWSPTGNAFVVHDREAMVEHIIPKFFDHKKWRSFTRQLNLWGFKRELRGPNVAEEGERYYHKYFNRGKLDELQLIERTEVKRKSTKKQQPSSSFSQQIAVMTANQNDGFKIQGANPQQTGDITQGASFLTGLKGEANFLPGISAPGGGPLPTTANCMNMNMMQGPGPMRMSNNMASYKTSSLPPTMQSQMMMPQMMNPRMMNQQMMMQQQMMMGQPQMYQGFTTSSTEGNWNPNQLNRGMLNQQYPAMASNNMNGMSMSSMYSNGNNGMNSMRMMQPSQTALGYNNLSDGAHATLRAVSDSNSRGDIALNSFSAPPNLGVGEGDKANEGDSQLLSQQTPV